MSDICPTCRRPVELPSQLCSAVHQPWMYEDGKYVGVACIFCGNLHPKVNVCSDCYAAGCREIDLEPEGRIEVRAIEILASDCDIELSWARRIFRAFRPDDPQRLDCIERAKKNE